MSAFEPSRQQDKVVMLKRVPLFASCSEEQFHLIAELTRLVEYKKGEYIYREGEPAEAFSIIITGRLRVFSMSDGKEKTLAILHNGDSFGEISLLTGETHSATIEALNDTLILQLAKKDFDDVINRIPSLVLYLSRLLSKRLRTQGHPAEFSDATIIAIYSAAKGVGRTCLTISLASTLRRETGHPVVVVNFSGPDGGQTQLYGTTGSAQTLRMTVLDGATDDSISASLFEHPLGFSVLVGRELFLEPRGPETIAPLLNLLTNRFRYILIDLPVEVTPPVLKALTQSDLVYVVTDPQREHVIRTNALLHQLRSSIGSLDRRVKLVLNLLQAPSEVPVNQAELMQQLGEPVAFTLPYVASLSEQLATEELARLLESRTSPYGVMIRHMARELGGLLVGLALGSGAALGLAHIGVLKVIEREKIPIDVIAGSSIGALVGGLWASGHSADDLEQMALRFKKWDIRKLFMLDLGLPAFSLILGAVVGIAIGWLVEFWTGLLFGSMVTLVFGLTFGPLVGGPIHGARLMAKLQEDFAGKTFEDTWLPLKIVAANPLAREEVVFESGSLVDAVRASVSIPGIFKPVIRGGKVCLDGGVVNPVPVSVLKRAGVKHVIAVNVFPTTAEITAHLQQIQQRRVERDAQLASRSLPVRLMLRIRQELLRSLSPLVFDVIMRSMQSMEYQIAEVGCRDADFTLRPTVPGSHWLEFFSPEKFIRRGEEVTLQYLPELKRITRAPGVDNLSHDQ